MKLIPLTQGKFTKVDDENFDYLNQWKWYLSSNGYAMRTGGKHKTRPLHAFLLKAPKGKLIDHIDQDKLNNQEYNFRLTDKSINAFNSKRRKDNKSGYRGVHWFKRDGTWESQIQVNTKKLFLGRFKDINDAIEVYLNARTKYLLDKGISL